MKPSIAGLVAVLTSMTAVSAAPQSAALQTMDIEIPPGNMNPQVFPTQTPLPGDEKEPEHKWNIVAPDDVAYYDPLLDETDLPVKIIVTTKDRKKHPDAHGFIVYARDPVNRQILISEIEESCGKVKNQNLNEGCMCHHKDMWRGNWKVKVQGQLEDLMSWDHARSCLEKAVLTSGGPRLEPEKYGEREEVKDGEHLATDRHKTGLPDGPLPHEKEEEEGYEDINYQALMSTMSRPRSA